MNVALEDRNVYENFDTESDVLYFKVGMQGLVSFHGKNYNRKKRMSTEEMQKLTQQSNYFQIKSNCYVNLAKIKSVADGTVYFGSEHSDAKQLPINRRKQYVIEQLFSQRDKSKEARNQLS
ncbi:LytTR family transcriptional regulator DNA-binding domain-containing protein [Paenibacillus sp. HB172176]|uniref:LytTR family transcriptional regulator DNA-binding domain-containing protein n=1 Tax=Paenibacillus sp. HB172176 TaxID=2493690 RepID=UPI00143B55FB|nr:LytTR family transcriptional regulator DNA-binding domain-containing protein [Paenibacillus sp. HB172176]